MRFHVAVSRIFIPIFPSYEDVALGGLGRISPRTRSATPPSRMAILTSCAPAPRSKPRSAQPLKQRRVSELRSQLSRRVRELRPGGHRAAAPGVSRWRAASRRPARDLRGRWPCRSRAAGAANSFSSSCGKGRTRMIWSMRSIPRPPTAFLRSPRRTPRRSHVRLSGRQPERRRRRIFPDVPESDVFGGCCRTSCLTRSPANLYQIFAEVVSSGRPRKFEHSLRTAAGATFI